VEEKMKQGGQIQEVLKRLPKHRGGSIGALLLMFYIFISVFGPMFALNDPYVQDLGLSLRGGFWSNSYVPSHFLGTDLHGRDIFARVLYGGRLTVGMGLATVLVSTSLGLIFGILAGYYGGLLDQCLMVVNDALMSFPTILLAIIFIAILGPGLDKAIVAVAFVYTPRMVRVVRGATLGIRELDYLLSAKAIGATSFRIQTKHILPNVLAPVIVQVTFSMSQAITTIAGLGFLGLGAQPPLPEWGAMLSDSLRYMMGGIWWYPFIPGLMITGIVLGFNMAGDGLRDVLDPKLKKSKK
jgi:ABC-type dipeptide/oligopeptide/nickel transport system permease subunit